MVIFSLNHSFIGRTTRGPGPAGGAARHTTRGEACTEVTGARMPTDRASMMKWLDQQQEGDRKNARVINKVIATLPLELDHEQNKELIEAFAERMTEGRAARAAAFHDGPRDANNPRARIIFRDRESGKRVILTTEKGGTQRFRDRWEQEANIALERAGRDERIDKRRLPDQGIDREPQIDVGAAAEKLAERDYEFPSNAREITRVPVIDEDKTRFEENMTAARRSELKAFLQRRDRERHIDRGR